MFIMNQKTINLFFRLAFCIFTAFTATSCGDSESFTVEGTIEGNPTLNLRYLYYSNNALQQGITAAREGKFTFKGSSQTPTVIEITDNDYRLIGRIYAVNGNRIECRLDRNNPNNINTEGNDVGERWSRFLRDNAEALASPGANTIIERYIADRPDDVVSTLLLVTSYNSAGNAARVDSLLETIATEARPSTLTDGYNYLLQRLVAAEATSEVRPIVYFNSRDSLETYNPSRSKYSLIAVRPSHFKVSDSITPELRSLAGKYKTRTLRIVDFSTETDTTVWKTEVRGDSASWSRGILVASVATPGIDRLGIPALPYFIVVDSTGTQHYRGQSVKAARADIERLLDR